MPGKDRAGEGQWAQPSELSQDSAVGLGIGPSCASQPSKEPQPDVLGHTNTCLSAPKNPRALSRDWCQQKEFQAQFGRAHAQVPEDPKFTLRNDFTQQ